MKDRKEKNQKEVLKERLLRKISGEIVLSDNPGKTIKKWRNIFEISQRDLADQMDVMPSVISDYELGRRESPGIRMIRKMVNSLLSVDEKRGGDILREFSDFSPTTLLSGSVLDMKEFQRGVTIEEFCEKGGIDLVANENLASREIYGYSIIDSLKAIVDLSPTELVKLYGLTTERALIFTKVSSGRSPMVAIKVTNLKPGFVVFHGDLTQIDELAKRIAEAESVPVGICRCEDADELKENLREEFG